jgi:hypothetical protein
MTLIGLIETLRELHFYVTTASDARTCFTRPKRQLIAIHRQLYELAKTSAPKRALNLKRRAVALNADETVGQGLGGKFRPGREEDRDSILPNTSNNENGEPSCSISRHRKSFHSRRS